MESSCRSYYHSSTESWQTLQINPTTCTILLSIFISLLYMIQATMCPSSGEITVSMRYWCLSQFCVVYLFHFPTCFVKRVSIIRRNYCICATLMFVTLYGFASGRLVGVNVSASVCQSSGEITVSVRH